MVGIEFGGGGRREVDKYIEKPTKGTKDG